VLELGDEISAADPPLLLNNSDITIAKAQTPKAIDVLAAEVGIPAHDLEMYGRYKAKVKLEILDSLKHRR
jgi:methylenetetrahydrofolate dehydrogenase (NADP+) / methenyltetrahydrofolate cyclohydrolase / formyltetrahydrofolate synthetase